MPELNKFTN